MRMISKHFIMPFFNTSRYSLLNILIKKSTADIILLSDIFLTKRLSLVVITHQLLLYVFSFIFPPQFFVFFFQFLHLIFHLFPPFLHLASIFLPFSSVMIEFVLKLFILLVLSLFVIL